MSLIQSNHANVASGASTLNIAYNSAVTAGNFLVVYVGSTAGGRTFTASDSVNGAWNVDISPGQSQAILSFLSTAAGTPTVTVTMSGAAGEIDAIIEEWSGVLTSAALDQTASISNAAATSGTSGTTGTLAQANELCLAMIQLGSPAGAASISATAPFSASTGSPWPAGNQALIGAANNQPNSTAAVSASFAWTASVPSKGCIATYRLGVVTPPPVASFFAVLP